MIVGGKMVDIDKDILIQAIEKWGDSIQLDMVVEEMSELIKEICKYKRGRVNRSEIIEEIADVSIMLEQAKIIFGISDGEINDVAHTKIGRLKYKLMEGK